MFQVQRSNRLTHLLRLIVSGLVFVLIFTAMPVTASTDGFFARLAAAALERTHHRVRYDGGYYRISYPWGDVPKSIGVCTDVVIRAYRALGVDLQQWVHEDMRSGFASYPNHWGLRQPDPNIDHRRVANLQRFFQRHGQALSVSQQAKDYRPGDVVTWLLPGNLPHIGIVSPLQNHYSGRPLVVHNIGQGPKLEDVLFAHPISGHYRFRPEL